MFGEVGVGLIPALGVNPSRRISRKLAGEEIFQCCHLAYNIISRMFIKAVVFYFKYMLIKAMKTILSRLDFSILKIEAENLVEILITSFCKRQGK